MADIFFPHSDILQQANDAFYKKDYLTAIKLYEKAAKLDLHDASPYYGLVESQLLVGLWDDAIRSISVALDREEPITHKAIFYLYLAIAHMYKANASAMREDLTRLCKLFMDQKLGKINLDYYPVPNAICDMIQEIKSPRDKDVLVKICDFLHKTYDNRIYESLPALFAWMHRNGWIPADLVDPIALLVEKTPSELPLKDATSHNILFAPGVSGVVHIQDCYVKFPCKDAGGAGRVWACVAKDGSLLGIKIYGQPADCIPCDPYYARLILRTIGERGVASFKKIVLYALEQGKVQLGDKNDVFLNVVLGDPGKKKAISTTKKIVLACKSCDAMITMAREFDESKRSSCPCCDKALETYWREGRVIPVELGSDPKDWDQLILGNGIPVLLQGVARPARIENDEALRFAEMYGNACPGNMIGPLCLEIKHTDLYNHVAISPMHGAGLVIGDVFEPFPKDLIYPKKLIHDGVMPGSSNRQSEIKDRADELSAKAGARKLKAKVNKFDRVDLEVAARDGTFDAKKALASVYLRFIDAFQVYRAQGYYSEGPFRRSYFEVTFNKEDGKEVPITISFTKEGQPHCETFTKITVKESALPQIIGFIQRNEGLFFSEVKLFAQESTLQFDQGPIHQYLKPILNEPGKISRLEREGRLVGACKECNAMLLRFTYNNVVQRDDFQLKECPYCKKPLSVVERKPRFVPVMLDFNATGCVIEGTNNQLGVLYNGVPVKLTVKVKSMLHFLQNYQCLFENKAIGPFDIRFTTRQSRLTIGNIVFSGKQKAIEWRPVVLYPEDLIAF
nr:hypothetical protein [Candidatus Sigynarchaeota archaeon]